MYVLFLISVSSHTHCMRFLYFATIQFTENRKLYYARKNTIFQEYSSIRIPYSLFTGGASYSPEYYINIRTGIHYFPKGNATIDPGSNRFKSGLNRIEEKLDEVLKKIICLAILLFVQLLM